MAYQAWRYLRADCYSESSGFAARVTDITYYEYLTATEYPASNMTTNSAPTPYVASSDNDGTNAYLAYDSDTTTTYWSVGNGSVSPKYNKIDLGSSNTRVVDQVRIRTINSANRKINRALIYGSTDDSSWTLLADYNPGSSFYDVTISLSLISTGSGITVTDSTTNLSLSSISASVISSTKVVADTTNISLSTISSSVFISYSVSVISSNLSLSANDVTISSISNQTVFPTSTNISLTPINTESGSKGVTFFYDTFNGNIGDLLSSHTADSGQSWTKHTSTTGTVQLTSSGTIRQSNNTTGAYWANQAVSGYYDVEFGYRKYGSIRTTVVVFGGLASNAVTGYGARYSTDNGGWDIIRYSGGTSTTIAGPFTYTLQDNLTYTGVFIVRNNIKKLLINNEEILSVNDSTISTSGYPGVRFFSATTTPTDTNGHQLDYLDYYVPTSSGVACTLRPSTTNIKIEDQVPVGMPRVVSPSTSNIGLDSIPVLAKARPPTLLTTDSRFNEIKTLVTQSGTLHYDAYKELVKNASTNDWSGWYYNSSNVPYSKMCLALEEAFIYRITGSGQYASWAYSWLYDVETDGDGVGIDEGYGLARATISNAAAVVYSWCYDGLSYSEKTWMNNLMQSGLTGWTTFSHANIDDSDKTSNWVGKTRGGEMMLILATQSENTSSSRLNTCRNDISKHIDAHGNNGLGQEGLSYLQFGLQLSIGAAYSDYLINNYTATLDKLRTKNYDYQNIFRISNNVMRDDARYLEGISNGVDAGGVNPNGHIAPFFIATSPSRLKYFKYWYDNAYGLGSKLSGQYRFDWAGMGVGNTGKGLVMLWYPNDVTAEDPQGVVPLGFKDDNGLAIFRNGYGGQYDKIVSIHAYKTYYDHAWHDAEAFKLGIISNGDKFTGEPYTYSGSGQLYSTLLVNDVPYSNQDHTSSITYFNTSGNKGYAIVNGGQQYSSMGLSGAYRHLFVDFVDNSSFSVFSTLDKLRSATSKKYSWQIKVGHGREGDDGIVTTKGTESGVPYFLLSSPEQNSWLKLWQISSASGLNLNNNLAINSGIVVDGTDMGTNIQFNHYATDVDLWTIIAAGVGTPYSGVIVSGSGLNSTFLVNNTYLTYDSVEDRIESSGVQASGSSVTITASGSPLTFNPYSVSTYGSSNFIDANNNINLFPVNIGTITGSNIIDSFTQVSLDHHIVTVKTNVNVATSTINVSFSSESISVKSNVKIADLDTNLSLSSIPANVDSAGNITIVTSTSDILLSSSVSSIVANSNTVVNSSNLVVDPVSVSSFGSSSIIANISNINLSAVSELIKTSSTHIVGVSDISLSSIGVSIKTGSTVTQSTNNVSLDSTPTIIVTTANVIQNSSSIILNTIPSSVSGLSFVSVNDTNLSLSSGLTSVAGSVIVSVETTNLFLVQLSPELKTGITVSSTSLNISLQQINPSINYGLLVNTTTSNLALTQYSPSVSSSGFTDVIVDTTNLSLSSIQTTLKSSSLVNVDSSNLSIEEVSVLTIGNCLVQASTYSLQLASIASSVIGSAKQLPDAINLSLSSVVVTSTGSSKFTDITNNLVLLSNEAVISGAGSVIVIVDSVNLTLTAIQSSVVANSIQTVQVNTINLDLDEQSYSISTGVRISAITSNISLFPQDVIVSGSSNYLVSYSNVVISSQQPTIVANSSSMVPTTLMNINSISASTVVGKFVTTSTQNFQFSSVYATIKSNSLAICENSEINVSPTLVNVRGSCVVSCSTVSLVINNPQVIVKYGSTHSASESSLILSKINSNIITFSNIVVSVKNINLVSHPATVLSSFSHIVYADTSNMYLTSNIATLVDVLTKYNMDVPYVYWRGKQKLVAPMSIDVGPPKPNRFR